jgi:hypothetical protein
MTTTKPITTRRTARAAARVHAEHDLYETIRDAGRDAMQSGESVDDAERETARNIAAHPGGASEAWCNAGASRIVGIPARWEAVFLREYDRATTAYARHFLTVVSPD